MKTITTNVFELSELSPRAKEKAREWYRSIPGMWDGEFTIEDAKQCLAYAGFSIDRIFYSGFSSQGDGACFEGSWGKWDGKTFPVPNVAAMKERAPLDKELHRIAEECERISKLFPSVSMSVKHRGHYYHQLCPDFTVSICDARNNEIESANKTEKDLIKVSLDAMQWIYRQLEEDYNYANADEQVDETIIANGYTFTENGERFGD